MGPYINGMKESFNLAAQREVARLPHLLSHLYLGSKDGAFFLTDLLQDGLPSNVHAYLKNFMTACLQKNSSAVAFAVKAPVLMDGHSLHYIGLNLDLPLQEDERVYISESFPIGIEQQTVFLHEAGHLLVRRGYDDTYPATLNEAAADAYAILRHIQCFGDDSDILPFRIKKACVYLVLYGEQDHFTAGVVDKIRSLKSAEIKAMTPEETIIQAGKFARDYFVEPSLARHLSSVFSEARAVINKTGHIDLAGIKKVISTLRQHQDDPAVYYVGRTFLSAVPGFDDMMNDQTHKEPKSKNNLSFLKEKDQAGPLDFSKIIEDRTISWLPRTVLADVKAGIRKISRSF